ncbi:hypothetical protein D3C71_1755880 [compost metagenome]
MFSSREPVLSVWPTTFRRVLSNSATTMATPDRVLAPAAFSWALELSKVTLFGMLRISSSPLRVTLTPVPCSFSRSLASCTSM